MKNNLGKRMKQLNRRNIQIRCVNSVVRKSPSRWDELLTYATSNVIAVVSAVGAFLGGIIILIYLMDENYFPADINVSSIGLLLAAAAIVGILLTILFALYFILPGYVYRYILVDFFKEDPIKPLEHPTILLFLDIPAITIAIIFLIFISSVKASANWSPSFLLLVFPIALIAAVICVYLNTDKTDIKKWVNAFTVAIVSAFMAFIPWLLILLFAMQYSQKSTSDKEVWISLVAVVIPVIISNHLIAAAKKWWLSVIVAPVLLFVILVLMDQKAFVPHKAVQALTIGDIRNATLQLDEQGCQIAMQYLSASSEVKKSKPTLCTLAPVRIVWRIGNEYWVSLNEVKDKAVPQAKEATPASLSFVVDDKDSKIECAKVEATTSLSECSSTAVDVNKPKSKLPSFEPNSKFSLPASHVLSWAITPPQASQSQK